MTTYRTFPGFTPDDWRTVANEGAVILRYRSPRGLPLYDRYVASVRFCEQGDVRRRAFVPSADRQSCQVYKCKRPDYERRRRLWLDD